jgi:sugar/nucleoside kinase (ribokinase family)
MLWDRNGGNLQVTPGSVGMAINEKPRVVLESAAGDSKLWLMDSTGTGQALNAGLLADLAARHSAKPAPKHRRKR